MKYTLSMTENSAYINVKVAVHLPGCPDVFPPPASLAVDTAVFWDVTLRSGR
jgi:hypothetical protein